MPVSRRSFLSLGALGSAACAHLAAAAAERIEGADTSYLDPRKGLHPFSQRPGARRPHIFLITVDMISPDHYLPSRPMSAMLEMPALQGLFSESVFFQNAFSTSPLCAPARAALLTGRATYIMANNERAHDGHEFSLRAGDAIFPEYLKATGYVTKHCGKGHLGPQKFLDAFDENADGWDRWDPPIRSDESYLQYLRRLGVKPQRYRKEIRGLEQDRQTPANSVGGWIEQEDGKPFPLEAQYSYFLAERAIEKLDAALASSDGRRPIYLQLDFFDPHQPFSIPDGFEKRASALARTFRLPDSYQQVRARDWMPAPNQPRIYDLYRKYWGLYQEQTVADYRVANALQMEVVDRAIGHFLRALRARGLYDESLILFTADHGEMNGREAVVDKGVYLHPEVMRVPLAIKMPRSLGIAPRQVAEVVSHLDLAPTLLELASIQPSGRQDGVSLMPLLEQRPHPARPFLLECGWHVGVNFACGCVRRLPEGLFLYAYNASSDIDELYRLEEEDPRNLSREPDYARPRRTLIQELGAFLEADPRWRAWWSPYRLDHYAHLPQRGGDMQMRTHD